MQILRCEGAPFKLVTPVFTPLTPLTPSPFPDAFAALTGKGCPVHIGRFSV